MVAAGPNTSVSCTALPLASGARIRVGATKADLAGSMPSIFGRLDAAGQHLRLARDFRNAVERRRLLAARDHRTHARGFVARIAERGFLQAREQGFGHRVGAFGRHEDAADGGAFLPGLHRHLAADFLDEGIEGRLCPAPHPAPAARH